MVDRKMLIVGGGFAGMALAIRMREMNWSVDLVEIDPEWRVYGAGISITGPTYRAARRLGIAEELISRGYGSHGGVRICAPNGRMVAEIPARPIEPGLPTAGGIMRPVMHDIMSSRTRACGTRVRLGVTLKSYTEIDERVRVETSDGQTSDYSLVVAADGALAPFSGLLGTLRDGLSASSAIICRPLEAILLPLPWHRGRVLLIGDAVHATTPHLASGAGISIEDALVLSEELAAEGDVPQALERFEERRWARCRLVVENSVRIGQMEQTHADPVALKALMTESEVALRQEI